MTLVIVGARTPERMEESVRAFETAGFSRVMGLDLEDGDLVLGVSGDASRLLHEADRQGIKYVLVHDGEDDRHPGGTYERAHHRIEAGQRDELAHHLHSRERPLITCVAFGYKHGPPAEAALLIDARFLDNPYWVPELKPLSGRDQPVIDYVMQQPAAGKLLEDIERMVSDLLPLYQQKGRMHLVVAFGCTGGQHRSVVLAHELATRLRERDGIDVDFVARELD